MTPDELGADAVLAVAAGAAALHVHPRDDAGNETLEGAFVAAVLRAMRLRVDAPIGVTTGAWFLPDPLDRQRAIESWGTLPDFASVNFHEPGAIEVAHLLLERGVGVEAGIWNADAACLLVESGVAERCIRILVEPMEQQLEDALTNVERIEERLRGIAPDVPRLLHGCDSTAWPLLEHASKNGYDIRIGFEDTLELPDGSTAGDVAELVRAAAKYSARDGLSAGAAPGTTSERLSPPAQARLPEAPSM